MTAGGLVFVVDRVGSTLRAYDRDTGKEVWSRELPATSEGMPATYEVNGRQFIVVPVAAGTGQFAARFGGPPPRARRRRRAAPAAPPRRSRAPRAQGGAAGGGRGGGRGGAPPLPASTWCSRCRRSNDGGSTIQDPPYTVAVRRSRSGMRIRLRNPRFRSD